MATSPKVVGVLVSRLFPPLVRRWRGRFALGGKSDGDLLPAGNIGRIGAEHGPHARGAAADFPRRRTAIVRVWPAASFSGGSGSASYDGGVSTVNRPATSRSRRLLSTSEAVPAPACQVPGESPGVKASEGRGSRSTSSASGKAASPAKSAV